MLKILVGKDLFAKQAFIDSELVKFAGELVKYQPQDQLPTLESLGGANLFGGASCYVFVDCLHSYELEALQRVASNHTPVYFLEDSMDKRLAKTKQLLKLGVIDEFSAPKKEGAKLWIIAHAESLGIKIQPSAAGELANRLMGETKDELDVLRAHNELLKLSSYANDEAVSMAMVQELTPEDSAIDIFALINALGSKNKSLAIRLLQNYFDSSGEDQKVLSIRLVSLLADQMRSLLIAQDLVKQGLSEQQILQVTGWKSGRLFVMKKIGQEFTFIQLKRTLTKLYNLDKELKSSTLPPRIIIDLIVASM